MFQVKARDAAGNDSVTASHAWTVDGTAPPAPVVGSGPPPESSSGSATFTFSGEAGASFACSLGLSPYANCTSPLTYDGLSAGAHTFAVRARDAAGNESTAAGWSWAVISATPPRYAETVLSDHPRAYWRLGDRAGLVAADAAGAAPGSYAGGVVLGVPGAPGDTDTAIRLDGVNDLVNMNDPASGALDFAGDFTVELWARTPVNGERTLVAKRGSGPGWLLTVTDDPGHVGTVRATLSDGAVTRQGYSTARVDDDAWHHIVVVFDRDSGIGFFVDGVASGFTAGAIAGSIANATAFQLGKLSGYGYFRGDLDEAAVYPEALSPARVRAHYDAR